LAGAQTLSLERAPVSLVIQGVRMTFSEYLLHQLREMKREILTAMQDVPKDDLFSFEPCDHWPIGWIQRTISSLLSHVIIGPSVGL
jgi:hypothetical protein